MIVTDIQLKNSNDTVIALGHREDDYVLESVNWGTARVNVKPIYYFPTDDSERMLHTEWEPRPVSIIGFVIGKTETEIESKSQALENFLMVQSETDIIYNHYHLTFLPTAEIKWGITEVDNNEVLRKFQVTGVCIDPLWKNKSVIEDIDMYTIPMFFFPLFFNREDNKVVFGHRFGENSVVLDYNGASSGAIITLQSIGIIQDVIIYNQFGNSFHTFTLTGTYSAETIIVIDTREGFYTVTANGIDITGNVTEGSRWPRMYNGINMVTFYHSGTEQLDVDISIQQLDLFEVQT